MNNLKQRAEEAVVDKLGLSSVIDRHERDFLDMLASTHRQAQAVPGNSNLAFFADVIPWVISLIQVYGDRQNFVGAIQWAERVFKRTQQPISMLTVLTTIYLVERGRDKYAGTSQAAVWEEIHERLSTFLEEEQAHSEPYINSNCQIIKNKELPSKNVFISYSHHDKRWFDELQTHLAPYVNAIDLPIWDDTKIKPGSNWKENIKQALERATVGVLLVTPHFLASSFISTNELPELLKSAKTKGLMVLWVPIKHSSVSETPIIDFQSIIDPAHPLEGFSSTKRNKAFVEICAAIKRAYSE